VGTSSWQEDEQHVILAKVPGITPAMSGRRTRRYDGAVRRGAMMLQPMSQTGLLIRRAATSAALAEAAVLAVTAFAPATPDLHAVLANARTCRTAEACANSRATPQL
jgi:hypothetical protein